MTIIIRVAGRSGPGRRRRSIIIISYQLRSHFVLRSFFCSFSLELTFLSEQGRHRGATRGASSGRDGLGALRRTG